MIAGQVELVLAVEVVMEKHWGLRHLGLRYVDHLATVKETHQTCSGRISGALSVHELGRISLYLLE